MAEQKQGSQNCAILRVQPMQDLRLVARTVNNIHIACKELVTCDCVQVQLHLLGECGPAKQRIVEDKEVA